MSTYFSFNAEHFNNNGDQGNIAVLKFFLGRQDIALEEVNEITEAAFVLVGDASRAALREYAVPMMEMASGLEVRHAAGLPTLLIGSSYEFYASRVSWLETPKLGESVSEFRTTETNEAGQVFGYRNSRVMDFDFDRKGDFIATTFFGPILAKNPVVLDQILIACGGQAAVWPEEMKSCVDQVKRLHI